MGPRNGASNYWQRARQQLKLLLLEDEFVVVLVFFNVDSS